MKKEFFKKWLLLHKYCVICTSFKDRPWAATVNYTCYKNLNIYIRTNPKSLKFENLSRNPVVCLVIDSQSREGTLQIQAEAKPIKPKKKNSPNLIIKPIFMIFKKKEKSGVLKTIKLRL